jgi:tRNA 2-thiouridine synthesizing protein A
MTRLFAGRRRFGKGLRGPGRRGTAGAMTDPPAKDPPDAEPDAELDATGLLCPLPVLKARKRLAALAPGALLRLRTDDPAARVDVPHFCAEQGHALLAQGDAADGAMSFLIRKGGQTETA